MFLLGAWREGRCCSGAAAAAHVRTLTVSAAGPWGMSPSGAAGTKLRCREVPERGEQPPLSHTSLPCSRELGAGADEHFCACLDVLSFCFPVTNNINFKFKKPGQKACAGGPAGGCMCREVPPYLAASALPSQTRSYSIG